MDHKVQSKWDIITDTFLEEDFDLVKCITKNKYI